MDKYIYENLELYKYSFLSKIYFNLNPQLKLDNDYMVKIFEKACERSNIEFCIYLINTYTYIQNYLTDKDNCHKIILILCKFSDLEITKWFCEIKSQLVDIKNEEYLINSCVNPDYRVLRWLIKFNNCIREQINQYIFEKSLERYDILSMNLIYELNPNIDLRLINGFYLHKPNSLNFHLTNRIFEWLKNIASEQMFTLTYNCDFKLILTDNLIDLSNPNSNPDSDPNFNLTLDFESNYELETYFNKKENKYNECPICLDYSTKIISNCSHKYCSYCIRTWVKKNKSCPICRKSDEIKFYYI